MMSPLRPAINLLECSWTKTMVSAKLDNFRCNPNDDDGGGDEIVLKLMMLVNLRAPIFHTFRSDCCYFFAAQLPS